MYHEINKWQKYESPCIYYAGVSRKTEKTENQKKLNRNNRSKLKTDGLVFIFFKNQNIRFGFGFRPKTEP